MLPAVTQNLPCCEGVAPPRILLPLDMLPGRGVCPPSSTCRGLENGSGVANPFTMKSPTVN